MVDLLKCPSCGSRVIRDEKKGIGICCECGQENRYVFISYSSENREMADRIRNVFLEQDIPVWMAPYDIPVGEIYASVISDALESCSGLVLLLTEAAQKSQFVCREVEAAVSMNKPILPIRPKPFELNKTFRFFIKTNQILDLPKMNAADAAFSQFLEKVRYLAGRETIENRDISKEQPPEKQVRPSADGRLLRMLAAAAGAVALGLLAGFFLIFMGVLETKTDARKVSDCVQAVAWLMVENKNEEMFGITAFGVGSPGEPTDIFVANRYAIVTTDGSGKETFARNISIAYDGMAYQDSEAVLDDNRQAMVIDWDVQVDTVQKIPCYVLYDSPEHNIVILKAIQTVGDRIALELAPEAENAAPGEPIYCVGYNGFEADAFSRGNWERSERSVVVGEESRPIYTRTDTMGFSVENVMVAAGSVIRYISREGDDYLQHDAIEIKNGGPVVNSSGQVVGINMYSAEDACYSLSAEHIREVLEDAQVTCTPRKTAPVWLLAVALAMAVVSALLFWVQKRR